MNQRKYINSMGTYRVERFSLTRHSEAEAIFKRWQCAHNSGGGELHGHCVSVESPKSDSIWTYVKVVLAAVAVAVIIIYCD